mmetsp:Transcript_53854/g.172656  ORF Transcript_53854/g.172656 Transcript_53854/m.172656 type:complete len:287 (+) Transcript_53854:409-1269(+)
MQYCLHTRSRDTQKLVYSPSLCSKRCLSALLLAAKFTRVSVCSFIWASFCTVPSMLDQKAEHPWRISSTRFSSRRARNRDAEECVTASAADFSAAVGMYRTTTSSMPAVQLTGALALPPADDAAASSAPLPTLLLFGFRVGDEISSAMPYPSEPGPRALGITSGTKPRGSTFGTCDGVMPGAMKRRSRTSRFHASLSAPESIMGRSPPTLSAATLAPLPSCAWLSCSNNCRVHTFMEKGRFRVPLLVSEVAAAPAGVAAAPVVLLLLLMHLPPLPAPPRAMPSSRR